ncbi:MAG TPA: TPM domain-containing protein [Tepidisphaeraceae bacterium]|jgi:uncharacterized protein|nr:TPM domain-containing protein [Tepidisphaeraceae bacterium]
MRRIYSFILPMILALIGMSVMAAPAQAKSYGIDDGGHFFSADAVDRAERIINDIHRNEKHDVLVVTFASIPADRQEEFKFQDKQKFYDDWAEEIRKQNSVDGIVMLLVKSPGHLVIGVGNKTQENSFTLDDRDELTQKMLPLLGRNQYDDALVDAMNFIKARMRRTGANASAAPGPGSTATPGSTNYPSSPIVTRSTGIPPMGWLCAGIAILGVVFIIMSVINRNRNYGGGGYGAPPPGGYPPGYSGGYPQGGGYYGGGGGGGGFGRGLLGGLLGGALGAWGYERFNQGSGAPNYNPPPSGGGGNFGNTPDQSDTSLSSTGGDFGSSNDPGPSDSSSGGGDFGSSSDSGGGSDFGSSGGGSDFGSSGGDFGGGGDSGGGDSGGSGGGDF